MCVTSTVLPFAPPHTSTHLGTHEHHHICLQMTQPSVFFVLSLHTPSHVHMTQPSCLVIAHTIYKGHTHTHTASRGGHDDHGLKSVCVFSTLCDHYEKWMFVGNMAHEQPFGCMIIVKRCMWENKHGV